MSTVAKNQAEANKTGARYIECTRCRDKTGKGTGYWSPENGGICFKCGGYGYVPSKAESERLFRKSIVSSLLEASNTIIRCEAELAKGNLKKWVERGVREDLASGNAYLEALEQQWNERK